MPSSGHFWLYPHPYRDGLAALTQCTSMGGNWHLASADDGSTGVPDVGGREGGLQVDQRRLGRDSPRETAAKLRS